ncbi:MAG: hypothetical protein N2690_10395, partial [Rhodocyclaceae bacterium]|nr:hypothetical protein [Rhodocyclaceae bacterium]
FEDGFQLTALLKPRPGQQPGWLLASCLVRGQGTTEGFHRVEIPIPPKARLTLLHKQKRETLAHLAQSLLADAKDVSTALGVALTVLTEGGPDQADFKRVETWIGAARQQFAQQWNALYFPTLWRGADEAHEAVRAAWQQQLVDRAQALLNEAKSRLPLPANRRWRAVTQAHRAFIGMLRKAKLPLSAHARTESVATEETAA